MSRHALIAPVALAAALMGQPAASPAAELPEVHRVGSGPVPMLLIPCMSCRWTAWETFMERNADRYAMVAVTLPGFGGTPDPALPRDTDGTPWREHALDALVDLVDADGRSGLVIVGHSWGTMIAVQLAARRPQRVRAVIALDGSIESTTWAPADATARRKAARQISQSQGAALADAEAWHRFNGGHNPGAGDTFSRADVLAKLRRFGAFMATPRHVVIQYWRENMLVDLTADLARLDVPVLDVKCLRGDDQEGQRRAHLADLARAGVPEGVRSVFLYDTRHFLMDHRPEVLDRLVAQFLGGGPVLDYRP